MVLRLRLKRSKDEELLADCGMQLQTLGEVTKNLVVYWRLCWKLTALFSLVI